MTYPGHIRVLALLDTLPGDPVEVEVVATSANHVHVHTLVDFPVVKGHETTISMHLVGGSNDPWTVQESDQGTLYAYISRLGGHNDATPTAKQIVINGVVEFVNRWAQDNVATLLQAEINEQERTIRKLNDDIVELTVSLSAAKRDREAAVNWQAEVRTRLMALEN